MWMKEKQQQLTENEICLKQSNNIGNWFPLGKTTNIEKYELLLKDIASKLMTHLLQD